MKEIPNQTFIAAMLAATIFASQSVAQMRQLRPDALRLLIAQPLPQGGLFPVDTPQSQHSAEVTYATFDAPSGGSFSQFSPLAINAQGTVACSYFDGGAYHALIRARNGRITIFNVPGSVSTTAVAINDFGEITGSYNLANDPLAHGFVASPNLFDGSYSDRRIVKFDVPQASPQALGPGTVPSSINNFGAVAGTYQDEESGIHSFLLFKNIFTDTYSTKELITFDAPGAVTTIFGGTSATAVNDFGLVTGSYTDANYNTYSFLRRLDGTFVPISITDSTPSRYPALFSPYGSINDSGEIGGNYFESSSTIAYYGGTVRGFVRTPLGTYETFDAAVSSPFPTFTYVTGLNLAGQVTGYDDDQYSIFHGYTRDSNGTITLFDCPGAALSGNAGTLPTGINISGTVAGYYVDANSIAHGFVRIVKAH